MDAARRGGATFAAMTPDEFIDKWKHNTRPERAAYVEHFNDLCRLLDEPTPNEADKDGTRYAFEKGATKTAGGKGWADVWKQKCFAIEYKGRGKDLTAAFTQLQRYALALDSPPLLVVCDFETWIIKTAWTNSVSATHTIALEDLRDPKARALLKAMFSDPERLRPEQTREALTEKAAAEFAELAARLRARGHDPQAVAHFIQRIVFCLFADDVGLLPQGLFDRLLATGRRYPQRFEEFAARLFAAMKDKGGEIDFTPVDWFNGGLFDDATALPLVGQDIELLQRVALMDWSEMEPSIFGTLFERGLDPDKRGQLGAHYTDRTKIELIVQPVVVRPLMAEWEVARTKIAAAMEHANDAAASRAARNRARQDADQALRGFLDRLRRYRVLDPACGSGNFLYVALLALKDLEHRAMIEAEALGLQREFPQVGPEVVRGIELNAYAAELARVVVWIGAIQWARRHAMPMPSDPILKPLTDHILCADAVLAPDGTVAAWPAADAIIGNPPFIGDKAMIRQLGEDYVTRLRAAYEGRVPGAADFVCFWFEKAREMLAEGRSTRAGLVATNSIRGGANRRVLERVVADALIFDAWDDEPWTVDGAAVRVSLVCLVARGSTDERHLNGRNVTAIATDLTADGVDLLSAKPLAENKRAAFNGVQLTGEFDVPGDVARKWLAEPANPNGRPNSDVVRPWWNGLDVTRRNRDVWCVDFGSTMTDQEASFFARPFAHVVLYVKPVRATNKLEALRRLWWRHWRPRPEMQRAIAPLSRAIVTPEVSKHRVFAWLPKGVGADKNLIVVARDDDTTFGVLHSRFHEAWALKLCTWLGVGNDPRYTPTTTFETFPFPDGLTPDRPAASYESNPHAQTIAAAAWALVAARDRWLNPPEWVEERPEVVPGLPPRLVPRDAAAAAELKSRTLTALYNTRGKPEGAWLDALHADLDAAVAAAYGWPADLPEEEALARLLALNLARAPRP